MTDPGRAAVAWTVWVLVSAAWLYLMRKDNQ